MARFWVVLSVVAAITVAVGVEAQAPAPGGLPDCMTLAFSNLVDCLGYVQPGSNATAPAETCCSGISTVFNTDPLCLCQVFTNSSGLGIELNQTRALELPTACKLKDIPSVSVCDLLAPAGAPHAAGGPMAPGPESGATPSGPATHGSATAPGTAGTLGAGSSPAAAPEGKSAAGFISKLSTSFFLVGLSASLAAFF